MALSFVNTLFGLAQAQCESWAIQLGNAKTMEVAVYLQPTSLEIRRAGATTWRGLNLDYRAVESANQAGVSDLAKDDDQ